MIKRKTLRFRRSFLSQNVTHRIRVVKKCQDFYHCGRWLHHHNSAILLSKTVFDSDNLFLHVLKAIAS